MQLGGIIKPNDGLCHLDPENDMYVEDLNQDYPSLGQISRFAKDNDMNIIFAVTNDVAFSYQEFSKFVSGSSVAILGPDSANIVDLVRETYEVSWNLCLINKASLCLNMLAFRKFIENFLVS